MMKHYLILSLLPLIVACTSNVTATDEEQTDANTPLHLLRPDYDTPYVIPQADSVKAVMDRILNYVDTTTFMQLDESGKQLKRGTFRLTSYEWGVTYSAMLRAGEVTGDEAYTRYATDRMTYLAKLAPQFSERLQQGEDIDPLMRQVVAPAALDDCGAICSAMIKSGLPELQSQVETYYDYIANHQYRYTDGQFARLRPVKNTVWLDDMFMGIPALALHGNWQEAERQFRLFHDKMWVPSVGLYRHGWVPAANADTDDAFHPSFFWARANGWALLTACELLDVQQSDYIMQCFLDQLHGLLPLQHQTGAWHQLLDRQDTYLETSCTAIYCYCLAHAINCGWIDAETYGAQALLAWNYVSSKVNELGQVEGTCVGTGLAFDPAFYAYRPVSKFAAHGYGPTIWAGAEIYRLVSTHHIKMNDSAIHFYPTDPGETEPIFYVEE